MCRQDSSRHTPCAVKTAIPYGTRSVPTTLHSVCRQNGHSLRHTECAYYFALRVPSKLPFLTAHGVCLLLCTPCAVKTAIPYGTRSVPTTFRQRLLPFSCLTGSGYNGRASISRSFHMTKTIADVDVNGKTVLMRVDFNVPPRRTSNRSPMIAGFAWPCLRSSPCWSGAARWS